MILPWQVVKAQTLSEVVDVACSQHDCATLSLKQLLTSYIYTMYKVKLIPIMYEKRNIAQYDIYLYFAYNFGWLPEEVDRQPADIIAYLMAKKIQRL